MKFPKSYAKMPALTICSDNFQQGMTKHNIVIFFQKIKSMFYISKDNIVWEQEWLFFLYNPEAVWNFILVQLSIVICGFGCEEHLQWAEIL